ncbi:MAG: hypothetical protein H6832_01215 [Planctomycetes bacterium]|nr:hypothetical protein [Planctomycetota bacterium]MCB9917004.1 hypothetical protein [Planctomycetota bacterium]
MKFRDCSSPSPVPRPASRPLGSIVFLCPHETYRRKMSRVRFHSMRAVGRIATVHWTGPGWPGWEDSIPVQRNLDRILEGRDPSWIIAYQPHRLVDFQCTRAPRCLRYNEMYDVDHTRREIEEARAHLVICHHHNDFLEWRGRLAREMDSPPRLVHIAHCAERRVFRDYGLPKKYDLLLVGARNVSTRLGTHYPLRDRMQGVLRSMASRYRCAIQDHPGYDHDDAYTDRYAIEFAMAVNSSRICITCSGAPKSRFGKYVEVPMCGTALAADVPDEAQDSIRSFVIELDPSWPDERISTTLAHWLDNPAALREQVDRGLAYARLYTQEQYARRLILELELASVRIENPIEVPS